MLATTPASAVPLAAWTLEINLLNPLRPLQARGRASAQPRGPRAQRAAEPGASCLRGTVRPTTRSQGPLAHHRAAKPYRSPPPLAAATIAANAPPNPPQRLCYARLQAAGS